MFLAQFYGLRLRRRPRWRKKKS